MKRPNVRRSQVVTTYGVGALVAFGDASYMVAGLDSWVVSAEPDLRDERLEARLHVRGFILPPSEGHRNVPVIRFPRFHSCKECNRLSDKTNFLTNQTCTCGGDLVPSRFVVCCSKGHIDDFPYYWWAHKEKHGAPGCVLSLEATSASASLASIFVKCSCGAARSMEGAFGKNAMRMCNGERPWISHDPQPCTERYRAVQRGASNVWFSAVDSSLSIPPYSGAIWQILEAHWDTLRAMPNEETMRIVLAQLSAVKGSNFPLDDFVSTAMQRQTGEGSRGTRMRSDEYLALCAGSVQKDGRDRFVCESAGDLKGNIRDYFDSVMLVKRLREVRALRGFTRLVPFAPGAEQATTAPLSDIPVDWRPAIEVNGEGVFFRFDKKRLADWETRPEVIARARKIGVEYEDMLAELKAESKLKVTPRLLLLHTFAHMLIHQWSLECGYPAASLRERLYIKDAGEDDDMAGVLIYTATGDSAGSLGGIIGLASPEKLDSTVIEALNRSAWCSADPLCIEAEAQGVNSLNLAACHACALLPEVSCEHFNVFLDRGTLVGWPEAPSSGFFQDLLVND